MTGLYSPINKLMEQVTRPKGTGAEYMAELAKKPGYKPAEAQDRDLQTLMALPQMERAAFMEKLKGQKNKFPLKMREIGGTQTHHESYTLPGGENYREILLHTPMPEGEGFPGVEYHFGGMPNILASVRVKDRMTPEGKKILHIEEIQSDWHQQGREKGYEDAHNKKQIEEISAQRAKLHDEWLAKSEELRLKNDPKPYIALAPITNQMRALWDQMSKLEEEPAIPYGPHAKDWHELALKAMIQHAAENGYDQIAVTPGAEQAKRYELSKHVGRITHMTHHDDPDSGILFAFDPKGNQIVEKHNVPHSQLPQYIGKEGARKLLEQKPDEHGYRELKDQDLEFGGEGMKGFYDKMVPTFLNKFGKKHGVQVQPGTVEAEPEWKLSKDENNQLVKTQVPRQWGVHTFDITPEMREDVLKNGIPRYAEGGEVDDADRMTPRSRGRASFKTAPRGNRIIKETGGNWLTGRVEKDVAPLKRPTAPRHTYINDQGMAVGEGYGRPMTADELERLNADPAYAANKALNKWVDSNLSNYIKKQMATPDDPVRKLAEEGITHKQGFDPALNYAGLREQREKAGFPAKGMGQSPLAKAWEQASDESIATHRAGDIQEMPSRFTKMEEAERKMVAAREELDKKFLNHIRNAGLNNREVAQMVRLYTDMDKARMIGDVDFKKLSDDYLASSHPRMSSYLELGRENPWISKVDPETPIHSSVTYDLGFDHIMDVLRQDLAAGRIRPEQMNKISISDAVRRTHQYDQDMAKKMAEAQAKVTEGMPVYKEYDTGHKWIELTQPKVDPKKELPTGYSLRKDNREIVKDEPWHVVDPDGAIVSGDRGLFFANPEDAIANTHKSESYGTLSKALKYEGDTMGHCVGGYCPDVAEGRSRIYSLRDAKGEPHVTIETQPMRGSELGRYAADLPDGEDVIAMKNPPQRIVQIKGKQNRAPDKKYLPMVQDFVKSGKWSDVGDAKNAGLRKYGDVFNVNEQRQIEKTGEQVPEHEWLAGDDVQRLHNAITPPGKRLKYDANGNVIGNEFGYAEGGEVEVRPTMKDDAIQRKIPEMEAAAKALQAGTITRKEYDKVVKQYKPVKPYTFIPKPATDEDADRALMANKKPQWRGHEQWPAGRKVGLRLDIPAYENHGVWVNSVHDEEGSGKDKYPTAYHSVSSVKNATFDASPDKAVRVATGEQNKSPFARIKGELHHITEDEAVEHMKQNLDNPDYAQVGMDPRRHGFFYDRKTLKPVTHSAHVVQIGPLVLAHKPTYGKRESYAEGGEVNQAAIGINVRSDKKANRQYADLIVDGRKTYESRNGDTLRPYVGKRVSIVRTGDGPAKAIGAVTIGEPMVVNRKKFREMEKHHLVPEGSAFDISSGTKHLYPMHDPERYENEKDVGHGIVARKIHMSEGGNVSRGTVKEKVTISPNMDVMQYELITKKVK